MSDPRRPPPDYWREPPVQGPRLSHWKGILVVAFILLAPALLLALHMMFGEFR